MSKKLTNEQANIFDICMKLNEEIEDKTDVIIDYRHISFGNGEYAIYLQDGRYIVYNELGNGFYTRLIDYEELGYYTKIYAENISHGNYMTSLDDYLYFNATSITWMDYRVICERDKIANNDFIIHLSESIAQEYN